MEAWNGADPGDSERSRGRGDSPFAPAAWKSIARELPLSERELQILKRVFDDQKESAIAAALEISVHTVHTHLRRIYRKAGVSSRIQLVIAVYRLWGRSR